MLTVLYLHRSCSACGLAHLGMIRCTFRAILYAWFTMPVRRGQEVREGLVGGERLRITIYVTDGMSGGPVSGQGWDPVVDCGARCRYVILVIMEHVGGTGARRGGPGGWERLTSLSTHFSQL